MYYPQYIAKEGKGYRGFNKEPHGHEEWYILTLQFSFGVLDITYLLHENKDFELDYDIVNKVVKKFIKDEIDM